MSINLETPMTSGSSEEMLAAERSRLLIAIGRRFREARVGAGLSQPDAARALRLSKQLISAVEAGRSMVTISALVAFSRHVNADLNWLITGEKSVGSERKAARSVPQLDRQHLLDRAAGRPLPTRLSTSVAPYGVYSDQAVAFSVPDRSMEPSYRMGDLVVVDPAVRPENGDCIAVALVAANVVLFRRVRGLPSGSPVTAPFAMHADQPDFEPRAIGEGDQAVFLGTLVEHVRFGAR